MTPQTSRGKGTPSGETAALDVPTFVMCVESGALESMAVLMVESLRTFGGRLAHAPVIAVTPRLGPPLAHPTRARFAELDVRFVRRLHLRRAWFPWLGKIWALRDAEPLATTETIVYIDCDMLVLDEPSALVLSPDVDVAAAHPDSGVVGLSTSDRRYERAWQRSCAAVGLELDRLPMVAPGDGSEPIRFYLNGGLVVAPRSTGFAERWADCTERLFRYRVDFGPWREQFHEQVSIGLAILRDGLAFDTLPYSYNYGIDSSMPEALRSPELATARLLHYHDQLKPEHRDATLERLRETHPEVAAWLATTDPLGSPASSASRFASRQLGRARNVSRRAYRLPGLPARRRHPGIYG